MDALTTLTAGSLVLHLRRAVFTDVPTVVELLAADPMTGKREDPDGDMEAYYRAFRTIDADSAHLLLVVVDDSDVVATFHLSFLPGLSRRGATKVQLRAVHVRETHRGRGVGAAMIRWALDEARRRGCAVAQLTTGRARTDAHRFYERLGFQATHEGLELPL